MDPMWQLQEYPLSKNAFYRSTENDNKVFFNFNDSIAAYLKLTGEDLEYANFSHYHAFDPTNPVFTKECDRIIHDHLVKYMNLAAVYFDDYQQFIKKQIGKPVTEKLLNTAIKLLREPKKYLDLALSYSAGKTFFHREIKEDFDKMIVSAKESLAEVDASVIKYRNMAKTLKTSKK